MGLCLNIFFFPTEIVAIELLDYIHIWIEDKVEAVEAGFEDGGLRHHFQAHLDQKDATNADDLVKYLDQGILIKNAISLFVMIANKILERN